MGFPGGLAGKESVHNVEDLGSIPGLGRSHGEGILLSGEAAQRINPTSKERWLHRHRRAERSYSMFKVRRGGCEEIPLIQGEEQWLRFARAAMKRYPTSKVRETQIRW